MIGLNLKDGKWTVVKFVEEHAHVLATPKRKHSHQNVSYIEKKLVIEMKDFNIPTELMNLSKGWI